jgi:predicted GIY-YIG superfamily endonuclease
MVEGVSAIPDDIHDIRETHERFLQFYNRAVAGGSNRAHHCVYVVYLRNPKGDGRAGYYVGMTGLTPEQRFENHKRGIKAASVVKRCGERLVPKLYAHLNPMTYEEAVAMERRLAEELAAQGYQVFGGH